MRSHIISTELDLDKSMVMWPSVQFRAAHCFTSLSCVWTCDMLWLFGSLFVHLSTSLIGYETNQSISHGLDHSLMWVTSYYFSVCSCYTIHPLLAAWGVLTETRWLSASTLTRLSRIGCCVTNPLCPISLILSWASLKWKYTVTSQHQVTVTVLQRSSLFNVFNCCSPRSLACFLFTL